MLCQKAPEWARALWPLGWAVTGPTHMTLRTIFETNEDRCGKSALSWWLGMCPCLLRFEVRVAWLKLPLGLSTLSCLQEHKLFFEIFVNLKPVRHCVQAKSQQPIFTCGCIHVPFADRYTSMCVYLLCVFPFLVCACVPAIICKQSFSLWTSQEVCLKTGHPLNSMAIIIFPLIWRPHFGGTFFWQTDLDVLEGIFH